MIRNLIFDLGNVLISFRPGEYLRTRGFSQEKAERILNDIFASREWLLLDNGDITTSQAIDGIASRSSLPRHEISSLFERRHEILFPLHANAEILPELKKRGFFLYYLSNFPADLWEHVRNTERDRYDFFRYFDGGIISAEARVSKPDSAIFEMLLKNYGLNAAECLYIDDLEENVKAAVKTGMKGITTWGMSPVSELISEALK